jgi:hypothetical protein
VSGDLDRLLDARDHDVLRALPAPAADALVRRALDRYLADDPLIDFERLLSLGVSLSRATHPTAAGSALEWLGSRPEPHRLDAAGALLMGLWRPLAENDQCSDERVGRYLDALDRLWTRGSDDVVTSAYVALRVLEAAVGCGATRTPALLRRLRAAAGELASLLPEPEARDLMARIRA